MYCATRDCAVAKPAQIMFVIKIYLPTLLYFFGIIFNNNINIIINVYIYYNL